MREQERQVFIEQRFAARASFNAELARMRAEVIER
jgi:hypothetical protein